MTGSASTGRSLAGRPKGPFGSLAVAAPGEVVQIDSNPLDVLVLLDDGVPGRVEMTGMIDVATRVVPAAVLRPTTKAADALVEKAGYVPVALGPDDYVELLPAEWRAVNVYGIKLNWRTYDREDGGLDPAAAGAVRHQGAQGPAGNPP